ncbi:hypothetical protein D6C76_10545 [Aureobasidium pullulans]|uniref:MFS general substrate transporter n=1 Tax=Aureobasidium pullulans TaxID=5580 RepID=A0AB74JDG6_AURPU|nr:hypothetical protein D6D12_10407 [Aureobasidium pullulans]TIA58931.1 hypothetical protein D6C76_10545 [Aureobasidium pullulans]
MTEPSETTSLIAVNGRRNESNESGCRHGTNHTDGNPDKFTYSGRTTVMLCGVFIIFFQFADILRFAPSLQLLELAYCRNYYSKHNPGLIDHAGHVPEHFCKLRDIQEHLSSTRAWLGFVEGLVGLVLVIPYGHLSERKGGCFVAALNLLGYALSSAWILMICFFWKTFPIDLIVVSPMLRAVGGGAPVSSAVILAIVANAAPTSKRSSVFFLMGAAEILTEMIMPVVSTTFLSKGFVYTPIFLGFVFEGLALVAICKVPLDTGVKHSQVAPVTNIPQSNNQNLPTARVGDADIERPGFLSSMLQEGQILNDAKVVILLGCFALVKVGRPMLEMLVQYMSKRYGWSFARVSSLLVN